MPLTLPSHFALSRLNEKANYPICYWSKPTGSKQDTENDVVAMMRLPRLITCAAGVTDPTSCMLHIMP